VQAFVRRLQTWAGDVIVAADGENVLFVGVGHGGDYVSFLRRQGYQELSRRSCGLLEEASRQITEYFKGERRTFDLPVRMMGTEFSRKVWSIVIQIPYGHLRSYKWVAEQLGINYARPVGRALAANHLMLIVPCHRVVASTMGLGGFSAGIRLKEALIKHEARHSNC
jgi:methylated-DNA-[protein]-cysteine S-methyltransferase